MGDAVSWNVLDLTATIVVAHVGRNQVAGDELPTLIRSVYHSLVTAGTVETVPAVAPTPAVPIKRSVFPEFIVCLEDGRRFKTLKRHLKVSYGMTPADYRLKWGLPPDYPMVAPAYASHRSSMAKSIGLGRKSSGRPEAPQAPQPEVTMVTARRARGSRGRD